MEIEDIDLSSLEIKDNDKKRGHSDVGDVAAIEFTEDSNIDQLRRSGRKKIRPMEVLEKRRVITRPRKLNLNSSLKEIENYYLDKKVKISSPALETIFEEPNKTMMSTRKLRRCIHFGDVPSEKPDKNKVKKRTMKAKKVIKGGFKKIGKKLGLEVLMNKLQDLDKCQELPS